MSQTKELAKKIDLQEQIALYPVELFDLCLEQKAYKTAIDILVKASELDKKNIKKFLEGPLKEISIELIPEINGYDTQEPEVPAELKSFLINSYDTIIDKYPNISDAYLYRGVYFMATCKMQSAIEDFTEYLKLNPANKFVYFLRGFCNDQQESVENDFRKAIISKTNLSDKLLFHDNEISANIKLIKDQLEKYPLITHTLDYSEFLKFVGLNASIEIMLQSLNIFFDIDLSKDKMELAKYLDKLSFEEKEPPEDIKNSIIEIFSYYPKFETSLSYILKRDGKDIFYINAKVSFLKEIAYQFIAQDIWWQYSALEYDDINGLHGLFSQKEINHQFNFTRLYVHLNEALQRQFVEVVERKEQEKSKARVDERNKIMADLSHHIKNLISTVIDPLENLHEEQIVKPQVIQNALRGANLVREIVNAMNLSFKGSTQDFFYDARYHKTADATDLQSIIIESLKHSISNMFDGKYFGNFMRNYFPSKTIFLEAKSQWTRLSQSDELQELLPFLKKNFFKIDIALDHADKLVLGNEKGSAMKLLILFQELILNAVKYSAFVNKEKRFVRIKFTRNDKQVSIKVENRFKANVKTKTSGIGHVIIENFAKLLNTKPTFPGNRDTYAVEIQFVNFWEATTK